MNSLKTDFLKKNRADHSTSLVLKTVLQDDLENYWIIVFMQASNRIINE